MKINEETGVFPNQEDAQKKRMPDIPLQGGTGHHARTKLILRVMKITVILLTTFMLHLSAATNAQITLKQNNGKLEKALEAISLQSGIDFVYSNTDFYDLKPVTVNLKNASIETALKACFQNQPLDYELREKTVVIKRANQTLIEKITAQFQEIDVRGRVVDEQGRSVPGATVRVKNGKGAAITDAKGEFLIKGVAEGAILTVAFVGYNTKEIFAGADVGLIGLEVATSKLDEIQVQAYGKSSQRLSTANISRVTAEDIAKSPVDNPLLALQGRVPGITIEQSSGIAGAGVKVRIQGISSLAKGSDPLYVINGIPYTSKLLPLLNTVQGSSGNTSPDPGGIGNPMSFINPSDIESIEILKDADATAIYGSRAAAGAILITTKSGIAGDTKVDVNFQQGFQEISKKLKLLNTRQYIEMRKEAKSNDGITELVTPYGFPDYDLLGKYGWSLDRSTDWQDILFGKTASYTNGQVTVSGGNSSTQFLIATGFQKQNTVQNTKLSDTKGSLNFNLGNSSFNQKLKTQLSVQYLYDYNRLPTLQGVENKFFAPNAPEVFNPDGSLNWALDENNNSTFANPYAQFEMKSINKTDNLVVNATSSYQLVSNLSFKSSFSYNILRTDESLATPSTFYSPNDRRDYGNYARSGSLNNSLINTWQVEPQLAYVTTIMNGKLDALLGMTFSQNNNSQDIVEAIGFSSDQLIQNFAAADITRFNQIRSTYKYAATFLRLGYNLSDKYLINISARRDGSSRFGSENKFHNFASISGAWIFSKENWAENLHGLSFGKIKASYGSTGNDAIGNYQYLSLYQPKSEGDLKFQNITALNPVELANPYLQWELTRKLNIGLDLGFLSDKILTTINFYRNRSSNQLTYTQLPFTVGFPGQQENLPATIQNSGVEFTLATTNVKNKHFSWSTNFNITSGKNAILVNFPGIEKTFYHNTAIVGQPFNIRKIFQYDGVDPVTGLYTFIDKNGQRNSHPDDVEDRVKIANPNPKFYGGLSNSLTLGNFNLDFLFQFTKTQGEDFYKFGDHPGNFNKNQPKAILRRWRDVGDNALIQRYSSLRESITDDPIARLGESNAILTDASFIRLKNVSISYAMPSKFLNRVKFSNMKFFILGQNLLAITPFEGLDPETADFLPPLRTLTAGIQLIL